MSMVSFFFSSFFLSEKSYCKYGKIVETLKSPYLTKISHKRIITRPIKRFEIYYLEQDPSTIHMIERAYEHA